ncbi:MAG: hypothetical protein ACN6RK_11765 [Stenotrophomonas sp.]
MSKDLASHGNSNLDRRMALTISLLLHLGAFSWMWFGGDQAGRGRSASPGSSIGDGMSAGFLLPSEFRQRIEVLPSSHDADIPETTERPTENEAVADVAVDVPSSMASSEPEEVQATDSTAAQTPEVASEKSLEAGRAQGGGDAGGNGDDGMRAAYLAALRAAIRLHWGHQENSQQCSLTIKQSPGGTVQSAVAGNCVLTPQDRRSLEAAALMAQPLPYEGFERVFSETTILDIEQ